MKRALERHYAGECRVIPVFLRACDWKGSPFGRLQGLPDDAIPVVSAQWPSRDDAFLRVAQGILRVAEKWRAEKTTASAKVADTPPTVSVPPPFAPREQEITQSIDDSGSGVIIDGKFFESDSVTEHDNSRVEVGIAPLSAEEEADLRALRPDQRPARRAVSFAHGNEGFLAQVRLARSQLTAGRRLWIVELERVDTNRHLNQDMSVNNITADEIAAMRALDYYCSANSLNRANGALKVWSLASSDCSDKTQSLQHFPRALGRECRRFNSVPSLRPTQRSLLAEDDKHVSRDPGASCRPGRESAASRAVPWTPRAELVFNSNNHRCRRRLPAGDWRFREEATKQAALSAAAMPKQNLT
jgi:hypothetical protein